MWFCIFGFYNIVITIYYIILTHLLFLIMGLVGGVGGLTTKLTEISCYWNKIG